MHKNIRNTVYINSSIIMKWIFFYGNELYLLQYI